MRNEIADLRSAPVAAQFQKDIKPGPAWVGFRAGRGRGQEPGASVARPDHLQRKRLERGINTSSLSGARAAAACGPLHHGGRRGDGRRRRRRAGRGGTVRRGASGKASRSIEDIKLVFDRNKGSIYTLYNAPCATTRRSRARWW